MTDLVVIRGYIYLCLREKNGRIKRRWRWKYFAKALGIIPPNEPLSSEEVEKVRKEK